MRTILFTGKRVDNGEWVEGDLFQSASGIMRIDAHENGQPWRGYPVDPETVGQFTGLKDKNGKKIFEGDILEITDMYDKSTIYFVEYKKGAFMLKQKGFDYHIYFDDVSEKYYHLEVIGNVHDTGILGGK